MDVIRRIASQNSDSSIINSINKLIYLTLSKLAGIVSFFMPVLNLSWIVPVIYVFWTSLGVLTVFALTLLSAVLYSIPDVAIYEPWTVLASDVMILISKPSSIAIISGLLYGLSVHITPPPTPSVTKRDAPKSHSNTKYYMYTILLIIGLGVSTVVETVGYSIAFISILLFLYGVRHLIEHDSETRNVYYKISTWLILTRVWAVISIVFVLAGGSVIYGFAILSGTLVFGWRFLQRRDVDSDKSLYMKVDSVRELAKINPYRFGYYTDMLTSEDEALEELEENLETAREHMSDTVSEENEPLLEDVYHEVLVFEDEYNRYSENDDINAESVKSMSKSDLINLKSKMREFISNEKIPMQVKMAASEVERKVERAIEEWN